MKLIKYLASLALVGVLVACGAGGGNPGTTSGGSANNVAGVTIGTSTATGTGTGTVATSAAPTISVSIVNAANVAVTSIAIGGGFKARAVVRDAAGAPVGNKLVTFSLNGSSIATLSPNTALTNASTGVAEVNISPISINSVGAANLSASADVAATAVSGQSDFAVSATNITLSSLTSGLTSLASGGGTSLATTALIAGAPASGVAVNVVYAASCGRINGVDTAAGGVSVPVNGSGVASVAYEAIKVSGELCSGLVTLSATSPGAPVQRLSINVADPVANAMTYISALPTKIFVAGSGALEQSLVKFKVLSSAGTPLSGVGVTFSIVTNPGGIGLNASGSTSDVSATSNANGEVSVSVFSGTIPGPIKVKAALSANPLVFSESQNLTVASGPPSQRFMSLSVETFNIEGWRVDGTTTRLTARVADRQGNAVEDGTVVNFTAEAGQVAVSCATARINGIALCSVDFQSQNPRPLGGRVSVMAYLAGTKDYVDVNGDNKYDPGIDTVVPIGDAYRDDNENAIFDAGEFVVPRLKTSACVGSGAPFPSVANTCDADLATTVRQQAIILYSSSAPSTQLSVLKPVLNGTPVQVVIAGVTQTFTAYSGISVNIASAENPLLPMPAGTTVSAEAVGTNCAVDKQFGSPVPNVNPTFDRNADLGTGFTASLKTCVSGDGVFIKVKSPGGLETVLGFNLP
jgi:hypothetical protein